jgi:uncharacterized protein (TIGR03083 family)
MSKQEFLEAARSAREALLAAVNGVDEAVLTTKPVCGTWTAKDVLGHLAMTDAGVLAAAQQARRGEKVTWAWDDAPDGDQYNEAQAAMRRNLSVAQVLSELRDTRRALVAELESWPADAGAFGPDTWDEKKSDIGWLASHEREHAEEFQALK